MPSTGNSPFAELPPIYTQLAEAKARKGIYTKHVMFQALICLSGLTFEQIAKEVGKDEVYVAAAFYGQVSSTLPRSYTLLGWFLIIAKLTLSRMCKPCA